MLEKFMNLYFYSITSNSLLLGDFEVLSKERITEIFRLDSNSFYSENDYLCADVLGIRILLPQRVYSFDCQYNCQMYPCAEGLFGIRVYEDYSCSRCFKAGELYEGTLKTLQTNIERIRKDIENIRMGY